jgi:hypothetical protein
VPKATYEIRRSVNWVDHPEVFTGGHASGFLTHESVRRVVLCERSADRVFGVPIGNGNKVLEALVLDIKGTHTHALSEVRCFAANTTGEGCRQRGAPLEVESSGFDQHQALLRQTRLTGVNSTRAVIFGFSIRLTRRSIACVA